MRLVLAALLLTLPAQAASDALLDALRSDLGDDVLEALPTGPVEAEVLLGRIAAADPGYHFASGPLSIDTDRRWFATLPGDAPGAPFFEVRRWPGDTVLAV